METEIVVFAPKRAFKQRKPVTRQSTRAQIKPRPKGKQKPKTLTWYKRELDRVFSLYIRAKYPKKCYTCGKEGVLQNGHFIVRKYLATRWDENNCRPQCIGCNIYGKGMSVDFEERLIKELGAEKVQLMKDSRKELWRLDLGFYEERIAHYKALIEVPAS